ncbi:hypothetical protein ACQEVB_10970 [Pseudonocardia sp. CA-107938]|uniref:hypothetical protein n=1 Tax=Pseudonocardia sp. CA-107938 TaxID=3240021 RepID=UPI003D935186
MDLPLIILAVLVVIAAAAPRYGVDSRRLRPGEGPARRGPTPWGDVATFVAFLRRLEIASVRPHRGTAWIRR